MATLINKRFAAQNTVYASRYSILPWNVDRVLLTFNAPAGEHTISLWHNRNNSNWTQIPLNVTWDPTYTGASVARVDLAPLEDGYYRLEVTDNPDFHFSVLKGDINRDGVVNAADMVLCRNLLETHETDGRVLGDSNVSLDDVNFIRQNIGHVR